MLSVVFTVGVPPATLTITFPGYMDQQTGRALVALGDLCVACHAPEERTLGAVVAVMSGAARPALPVAVTVVPPGGAPAADQTGVAANTGTDSTRARAPNQSETLARSLHELFTEPEHSTPPARIDAELAAKVIAWCAEERGREEMSASAVAGAVHDASRALCALITGRLVRQRT